MADKVRVPSVQDMSDGILIKHMKARHDEMIAEDYDPEIGEPDRVRRGEPPRLRAGVEWREFHDYMHRLYDGRTDGARDMYDHTHKEPTDGT
jgi:hypothetical protein